MNDPLEFLVVGNSYFFTPISGGAKSIARVQEIHLDTNPQYLVLGEDGAEGLAYRVADFLRIDLATVNTPAPAAGRAVSPASVIAASEEAAKQAAEKVNAELLAAARELLAQRDLPAVVAELVVVETPASTPSDALPPIAVVPPTVVRDLAPATPKPSPARRKK